jgi:TonB-dependent SusC/RagA subfamily outer membrane receptor
MVTKRLFFVLLIAVIAGGYSFAPMEGPIERLSKQLAKWADEYPVEKVYLQFDKPNYAAGDDIWFKAYVTSGSFNRPTTISGVVNVDLVNQWGQTQITLKLPLNNGSAAGDLALPDTLSGGTYYLRAYTNYMRNADLDYYFTQTITVVNNLVSKTAKYHYIPRNTPVDTADRKPDLQFFPEGGELVAGLPNQVAFKCLGPTGLGLDVKGTVVDGNGKQLAELNTSHLGMGKFSFVPLPGKKYTARISTANGLSFNYPLPQAADKGYVLHIPDAVSDNIAVQLTANNGALQSGTNKLLYLIAQSAGKICYTGTMEPRSEAYTTSISKDKFPTGIVQFTLFTAGGEPLLERLVFVKHADKLVLNVSAPQNSAPRQKVKINVDAKSNGQPVAGDFSVAVIDESKVPTNADNENHIMAGLLLKAELSGYIEQPAYYFNHNDSKALADLDLLMLTQGYHRFYWRQFNRDFWGTRIYRPEKALSIAGTITTTNGKPVANGKVQVIDIDNASYVLDTLTDANGRFAFNNLAFEDSIRFIVQARTANNKKDVKILLDTIPPGTTFRSGNNPELGIDNRDSLTVYTQASRLLYNAQRQAGVGNHIIPLAEVIIREKKIALKHSANLNGPGNADQVLLARDFRNFGCAYLSDCLQGRLLGVTFRNGVPYSTRGYRPMQVIIDGVYVESSFLNSINYNDVAAIEVLRNAGTTGIYGGRAGNGVIIVTTKRGDDNDNAYDGPTAGRGIKPYYPKGYYKARAFYSPRYDQSRTNKSLADLRSTIYWNPNLVTGSDGKASFEYFNAGGKGIYRIIIEGLDAEGNLARQVYRYRVE